MMEPTLLDRFFAHECNDYVRARLLETIRTHSHGCQRLTFNVFNVVLDFDAGVVTIEDALEVQPDSSTTLSEFQARLQRE